MTKKMLLGATLPGCLVLALVWAMLALSGGALANPPDGDGNHNHGGGGGGGGASLRATLGDNLGDRIFSDEFGVYFGSAEDGVKSKSFLWSINADIIPERRITLDFTECEPESVCVTMPDGGLSGETVSSLPDTATYVGASLTTNSANFRKLTQGDPPVDVVFFFKFHAEVEPGVRRHFILRFSPPDDENPDRTAASVVRTGDNTWVFSAGVFDVAQLTGRDADGNRITLGYFFMPFSLIAENI